MSSELEVKGRYGELLFVKDYPAQIKLVFL